MAFGDLQWAAARGGKTTGAERLAVVWEGLRFRMTRLLRRNPRAVGAASPSEVERMMAEVELPKTELVRRASDLVEQLGPPPVTTHVLRTYAWGTVLGLRDGLTWNREAFALAALFHDLGLSRRTQTKTCFAADGAHQALALLAEWGAPEELQQRVGNAVCLHLRIAVPPALGVEAHLVHDGAGVDVVGLRLAEIDAELQRRVLARHPRHALKKYLADVFTQERANHPASRVALWVRLGFLREISKAPFDS
jgi:hypothetical protein